MDTHPTTKDHAEELEERKRWLEAGEGALGEFRRDLLLEREQREGQLRALRQQLDEGSARLEAFAEKVLAQTCVGACCSNDFCGSRTPQKLAEQIAELRENGAACQADGAMSFVETVRASIRQLAEDVATEKANRSEALACVERRMDAMSATLYAQVAELRVCGDEASGCAQVAELRVAELATQLAGLAEKPARCCGESGTSGPANRATGDGAWLMGDGGENIVVPVLERKVKELAEKAAAQGVEKIRSYAEEVLEQLNALRTADLHMKGEQQATDGPNKAAILERKLDEMSSALNGQVAEIRASTNAVTERFNAQMLELRERADDDAVSIMEAVRADVYRLAEDLNKERASRCDQLGSIEQKLSLLGGSPPARPQVSEQGDASELGSGYPNQLGCVEQRWDHPGVPQPARLKVAMGQDDDSGWGPRLAA